MDYTNCWLEYPAISSSNTSRVWLTCNLDSELVQNAIKELKTGFKQLYAREIRKSTGEAVTRTSGAEIVLKLELGNADQSLNKDGYRLACSNGSCRISSYSEAGLLYGAFALLRNLQVQQVADFDQWIYEEDKTPSFPIRILNHWDNMDGSVERGYSGNSFFFADHKILGSKRIKAYARMIASVGINAVVINNVNVKGSATWLISDRYYGKLKEMSEIFAAYGTKLFLSINYAAPIEMSGLATADPCDKEVRHWWKAKAKEIWEKVPLMGGFLVKADSEGRPGPFTYGRTHADGANMLAEAIKPYSGLVIWRCFVYNCRQDWRDLKTDRARAGFDHFKPIDGQFADNVILQIKNGPMDFQVREPVSPLFGALKQTNMMLEVQIAQEYTGQQRHVCYLIPWFKELLAFRTYCTETKDSVADIVSGQTYGNLNCGMAAVTNTGNDCNWTGHDLAAVNLYGFGRLSFDKNLSAEAIASEWIVQTFGNIAKVKENILKILMMSWPTYEKYTSPLGIGWMVRPNGHYGPDVDGYEYDRWGTYHKADHKGIGVDRTAKGTGFCTQYNEPLASLYADVKTCPEELLLFFHRMEYDYVLSTGKTILQHIYDTHFEGAGEAETFFELWKELKGLIKEDSYERTLERFEHQKEHSKEWRDVINSYFYRKTGIGDQQGRTLY